MRSQIITIFFYKGSTTTTPTIGYLVKHSKGGKSKYLEEDKKEVVQRFLSKIDLSKVSTLYPKKHYL